MNTRKLFRFEIILKNGREFLEAAHVFGLTNENVGRIELGYLAVLDGHGSSEGAQHFS